MAFWRDVWGACSPCDRPSRRPSMCVPEMRRARSCSCSSSSLAPPHDSVLHACWTSPHRQGLHDLVLRRLQASHSTCSCKTELSSTALRPCPATCFCRTVRAAKCQLWCLAATVCVCMPQVWHLGRRPPGNAACICGRLARIVCWHRRWPQWHWFWAWRTGLRKKDRLIVWCHGAIAKVLCSWLSHQCLWRE